MAWSRSPKPWTPPQGREAEILARIEARAVEEGDCLLVQSRQRVPKVNVGGKVMTLQRAVWVLRGNELSEKRYLSSTCDDPACIAPGHLHTISERMKALRAVAALNASPSLIAKRKANGRKLRKLTDEQEDQIRHSEEPTAVLVERYGASRTTILDIKSGRRRASNFFSGLMR